MRPTETYENTSSRTGQSTNLKRTDYLCPSEDGLFRCTFYKIGQSRSILQLARARFLRSPFTAPAFLARLFMAA